MRIGIFVDAFFPMMDGVIACVDNYAKCLINQGDEVVVFAPRNRDKKYVDNFTYPVIRCKSMKVFFLDYDLPLPKFDKQFKKAIKSMHFDVIHIHSPFTIGSYASKYAKKNKIPCVATFHSQFKQDFKRALKFDWLANIALHKVVKVFNRVDLCLTMNDFTRNLLKEYGCKNKIELLSNATEMKFEKDIKYYKDIADEKFNLKGEKFVLLYVGRINKLKNVEFIVRSLALLPEDVKFKMLFVGTGQDKEELEKLTEKLGLKDKVLFIGKILDRDLLQTLYARSDLFLVPSRYDTDAIVKIEAACFSKPSVCLVDTGAGSAITNNKNGFLINENEQEFADLLKKLYQNPNIIKEVGQQAKKDIYVTWNEVIAKLKLYYQQLIVDNNEKIKNGQ